MRALAAAILAVSTVAQAAHAEDVGTPAADGAAGAPTAEGAAAPSLSAMAPEPAAPLSPPPEPLAPAEEATSTRVATTDAPPSTRKPLRVLLGGRVGYELPLGDIVDGYRLSKATSGLIPIGFDAVIQHVSGLELGLYAQLNFGVKGSALDSCGDCSVLGFRIGAQVNKHFNLDGTADPWLGLGVGIQELIFSEQSSGVGVTASGATRQVDIEYTWTYRAIPEALLQLGIDFGTDHLRVGPIASASISRYSKVESELKCTSLGCAGLDSSKGTDSISGSDRTFHSYVFIGVRGNYRL